MNLILKKTHPKSSIVQFHRESELAERMVSNTKPYLRKYEYNDEGYKKYKEDNGYVYITVLQIGVIGGGWLICEYIENINEIRFK